MRSGRQATRTRRAGRLALTALAAAAGPGAAADRGLADLKHVAWPYENGAPSRINALAQGGDGYIWIGGVEGLSRFDGIGFEPVAGPAGPKLNVSKLLATRSGALWAGLGRGGGVAVLRDGRLVDAHMPNPSREVTALAEDPQGGIWVARGGRSRLTLAVFARGAWREPGAEAGVPDAPLWAILFTRDGAQWIATDGAVLRRPSGGARFLPVGVAAAPRASLAQDEAGRVWLLDAHGLRVLAGPGAGDRLGSARGAAPFALGSRIGGAQLLFARDGDLWGAVSNGGLFRIHAPAGPGARPVRYGERDGLTSEQARALLQDREGDVWVGSELGLDMFRPARVTPEPAVPPHPASSFRLAVAGDGTVYVADGEALYAARPGAPMRKVRRLSSAAESLCAAREGGVWLFTADRLLRVDGARAAAAVRPAGAPSFGCAEDRDGRLWAPALEHGLWVREHGRWRAWPGLDGGRGVPANVALDATGRAAVLFRTPPPPLPDAPFQVVSPERFAAVGAVESLMAGADALFVAGGAGLARMDRRGEVRSLSARGRPWLASVNGVAQSPAGETWLFGDGGLARVRTADLDAAFLRPEAPLPARLFDVHDGLNSFPQKAPGAQAGVGGDGRVWLLTRRNPVRIDPAALSVNALPPPVSVRALSAGGRRFDARPGALLPAGTSALSVSYTALSFPAPGRVRFRHRLDGVDRGWVEAGGRREALYTGLRPGRYRFRVVAANDDGVWNPQGAALAFRIPPTFTQTWSFRLACALAAAAGLWAIYALRLRQLAGVYRGRLEARVAERERIARELHDTLLQGFQGLLLRFQATAERIPADQPSRAALEAALDVADRVLAEGRDRVRDLRGAEARVEFGDALRSSAARILAAEPGPQLRVTSEGRSRPLHALVHQELLRLAEEALRNAVRHAQAGQVSVDVAYARHAFHLRVADDGVGMPAEVALAGRPGRFGLVGMRERVRRVRGRLCIEPRVGGGTGGQGVGARPRGLRLARSFGGAGRRVPDVSRPIRILTVDDHPVLRDGVAAVLELQPDMEVVGEAGTGEEGVLAWRRLRPDVTLMDLQMPGAGGLEAIRAIRAEDTAARIVVLTTYAGDVQAVRALKAGAAGFLLKSSLRRELLDAIRAVHAGRRHVPGDVAGEIARHAADDQLTDREVAVLSRVAAGEANKEVARALGVSEETVKAHLKAIFAKLDVADRTHAVTVAARRGILTL